MICAHLKRDVCDLDLYGGRPSRGVCISVCDRRDAPDDPIPVTVSARPAAGNVVTQDAADARRSACVACEYSNDVGLMGCHCRKRGDRPSCARCRVVWSTNSASACPLDRWPAP